MRVKSSLITVAFNSSKTLRRFWSDVRPHRDVEWIVVDNASSDDSADVAEELGARVVRLAENLGFSAANNIGFENARGNFIGFVNPDVNVNFPDIHTLESLARGRNAVVAPQLTNADGSLQPNGRGYPFLSSKVMNRIAPGDGRYLLLADGQEPRPVCWLMGAAVFATRDAVEELGAWDPYFFLYYEDKDFSLRAWQAGMPVLIDPSVKWVHGWARDTKQFNFRAWKHEISSMARFYRRYPEFLLRTRAGRLAHPQIEAAVYGDTAA